MNLHYYNPVILLTVNCTNIPHERICKPKRNGHKEHKKGREGEFDNIHPLVFGQDKGSFPGGHGSPFDAISNEALDTASMFTEQLFEFYTCYHKDFP